MAISKVCKLELKANVDRVQKEKQISRRKAVELVANEIGLIGETVRKADLRARQELGQVVPTEWPKCKKCGTEEVAHATRTRPNKDRLCSQCRRQADETKLKVAQETFDAITVDAASDEFWRNFTASAQAKLADGIPLNKVEPETLTACLRLFRELGEHVAMLAEQSNPPGG